MGTPAFTNRLIHEKSPYLLQHAHNPVDWFPWGQEAFDLAKESDKPVFLSIGYATCHWCHVMEKESFENPEIAKLMNDTFVNIKVDREELPEIDSVYMEFAQALMSSAGGWPLNVVLTAELKPFFAMTYLPPVNKRGLIGMAQFIQHIRHIWSSNDRQQVLEQADKIVEIFEKMANSSGQELPSVQTVKVASELMYEFTDPVYGGLKGEPKFPMSYQALFLLEYARLAGDSRALFCAELTLDKMQRGGIYDHLGGGFSRYAVDEKWTVPHFEKMLYDNALMANTYLEAWKFTKKESYRETCEETLQYIMREMSHPDGGFYSAEDADSDGHEGLYYTWTPLEIREVLGIKEAELFCAFYGITSEGNFEGRSVLYIPTPLEEFAEEHSLNASDLKVQLALSQAALLKKRTFRSHPFKDDKIITSWNGLMIHALANAAASLSNETLAQGALQAAEFIKANLWKDGHLLRRWREGEARFSAGLDDYAFLIKGLLALFDQGWGSQWLQWAVQLSDILEKEFKAEGGAFYYKPQEPLLLLRKCEFYDGAEPSGNAVHAENLIRLFQITNLDSYLKQAEDILKAAKLYMETYPPGACYHLIALNRYFDLRAPTLVIALDEERSLEKEIKALLASQASLHLQPVWKSMDDQVLPTLIASLVDKKPLDGQTAVYICRQDHCEAPLLRKEDIFKALQHL